MLLASSGEEDNPLLRGFWEGKANNVVQGTWEGITDAPPYFFEWKPWSFEQLRDQAKRQMEAELENALSNIDEILNHIRNSAPPGLGKSELIAWLAAQGTNIVILVVPTHASVESVNNFEHKFTEYVKELNTGAKFRHLKAKHRPACSVCKKYDPTSERNEEGRIIGKLKCGVCNKILCNLPPEEFEKYGDFPGCSTNISSNLDYMVEMLVKYTQRDCYYIERVIFDLIPNLLEREGDRIAATLQEKIQKLISETDWEDRGHYKHIFKRDRDGNLINKLVCPDYNACLYQKLFLELSKLACIIVPFKQLEKVLHKIASELKDVKIWDLPNIVVVFDDSIEKDVYEELEIKPDLNYLHENNVKLTPVTVPAKTKGTQWKNEYHFYRLALREPIEVHDKRTKDLDQFFRGHDPTIYHEERKAISGKQKLNFLGESVDQVIYNCATTPDAVVAKMTGFKDWHVIGNSTLKANDPPNPIFVVKARSWSKKQFLEGDAADDAAQIIAHTLRVTRDRGKRVFVLTKMDYEVHWRTVKGEQVEEDGPLKEALRQYCEDRDFDRIDFVHFGKARGTNGFGYNDYEAIFIVGLYHYTTSTRFIYKLLGLSDKDIRGLENSEVIQGVHRPRLIFHPKTPIILLSDAKVFDEKAQQRATKFKLKMVLKSIETIDVPFWESPKKAKKSSKDAATFQWAQSKREERKISNNRLYQMAIAEKPLNVHTDRVKFLNAISPNIG